MRKFPCLIFSLVLLLAGRLSAQELDASQSQEFLKQLSAARSGAAFQADFTEEKSLSLMQKSIRESGKISFLPPDQFRREVTSQPASLTICDGETLWLYYPGFHEAEKYSLAKNRALRESLTAMTAGLRLDNLEKMFSISITMVADGHRLELVPRSAALKKAVSKLTITISPTFSPRGMEIVGAEGDRTITTFQNERRTNLSSSDFRFLPPRGVSVSEPLER